jgi:acyl-CoA thioesterase-1
MHHLVRRSYGVLVALCIVSATGGCNSEPRTAAAGEATVPKATATSSASAATAAEPIAGPKVIFLGDSVSAGIHLAEDEAFPAVLQRKLAARGAPFQLINAGVSGDTTAGGVRRVDWLLKQKPDIVVVELGANDAMRGVAPAEVEKNLRMILEKISAAGAEALLLGMRIPSSYGAEHSEAFAAAYERIADDLDVAFVPFFMNGVAGVAALNLEDGIHPTPEGHVRLAANVEDALLELVKETD